MITQIPLYKVRSSLQFRVAWVRQLKLYRSVGGRDDLPLTDKLKQFDLVGDAVNIGIRLGANKEYALEK